MVWCEHIPEEENLDIDDEGNYLFEIINLFYLI